MTNFRPLLWPTVFSLPMLLICLALGAWQVERLFWKQDLIAQRQAAVAAAPAAVPKGLAEARDMEFHHVSDQGVFLNDKEIFLGATSEGGGQGYQILTPLLEPRGRAVFVNRGYIPAELRDPARRAAGQIAGTVRVQGLLRLPPAGRPNWFLPDNRPDLNYWFWVDLPAMSAADKLDRVAPFYIDADATPNPGGWPKGGVTRLTLPNNHLQYAITWFSLAVALVVIYVLFHRRNAGLR
ncbi:MAG TPA: SURF1 family protein [Stellaceae bacterium]|jgi:surfeit locus 1 family protein|nr:SURF1 family protein [Stellaceae bacterium]